MSSKKKTKTENPKSQPEVVGEKKSSEVKNEEKLPSMEYRRLGKTGLKVSRLCVGCMSFGSKAWKEWVLEEKESTAIIKEAWVAGINFFDTADMYSLGESEIVFGKAVKQLGIPRDELVVATKCFFELPKPTPLNADAKMVQNSIKVNSSGLSRKHILDACDASLKRLQMDYIDLYQIHRWDNDTPIEETMKALHDLVQSGKVRYLGASTMHAWQFAKAQHVATINGWTPFSSMQNLYNLVYREEEREVIPMCVDQGVGVLPWSPLARGFLAGRKESVRKDVEEDRLRSWFDESSEKILDCVIEMAKKKNVTPAELSLAWVLAKEYVSAPIIGVSKPSHLGSCIRALAIKLSAEEIAELESQYKPREVLGWHTS